MTSMNINPNELEIFDITRSLDNNNIYEGDPKPKYSKIASIAKGDEYNISTIEFCVHNSTHIDTANHIADGVAGIAELQLSSCIGKCFVVDAMDEQIEKAIARVPAGTSKLLIKSKQPIGLLEAEQIVSLGIRLVGTELPTVGGEQEYLTHKTLLLNGSVILENIDLTNVEEGEYFLHAAPLKLITAEASPVRATLIKWRQDELTTA